MVIFDMTGPILLLLTLLVIGLIYASIWVAFTLGKKKQRKKEMKAAKKLFRANRREEK